MGNDGSKLNFSSAYDPEMRNLFRFLNENKPKQWDLDLSEEKFAYNRSTNLTQVSHFEIMYGQNPSRVLDLAPIPRIGILRIEAGEMVDYLRGVHDQAKKAIEDSNVLMNLFLAFCVCMI